MPAQPGTMSAPTGASNGFISTVQTIFTDAAKVSGAAASKWLSDQWGLNKGNGIDQQLFSNQEFQNARYGSDATAQPAGFIENVNISPNTALALVIAGVILFIALKA